MSSFNFKRNSKTSKGKPPITRMLCKDHTMYPVYFDELGRKRSEEEVKKIFDEMKKALEINNNSN